MSSSVAPPPSELTPTKLTPRAGPGLVNGVEDRNHLDAGPAPGGPEVEHDDLAAQRADGDGAGRAVDAREREVGRELAARDRAQHLDVARAPDRAVDGERQRQRDDRAARRRGRVCRRAARGLGRAIGSDAGSAAAPPPSRRSGRAGARARRERHATPAPRPRRRRRHRPRRLQPGRGPISRRERALDAGGDERGRIAGGRRDRDRARRRGDRARGT